MHRNLLLFLILVLPVASFGVSIRSSATVDQIEPGGVFEWHISVSGSTKQPAVGFGPFQLISGPSVSTQISFVNGQMSNSLELTYVLRAPQQAGTYQLPAVTLGSDASQPVTIVVTNDAARGNQPQQANPKAQGRNQPPAPSGKGAPNQTAWIEVTPSEKELYVGERVRVSYRLIFASARNLQITSLPAGSGFSAEPAREIKEFKIERVERQGRPYNSTVIQDLWITPTRAGTVEVQPLEVQVEVQQQVQRRVDPFSIFNDPFGMMGDPFGGVTIIPLTLKSPKITLRSKALPGGGGSDVWVGSIQASASLQPDRVPVHQSTSIVLTLKGSSVIKSLSIPELKSLTGIEVYPAQSKVFGDGDNIRREIRYPLLPRMPGKFALTFQPVKIFHTDTKSYQTILADTLWLTSDGTASGQSTMAYVPTQPASQYSAESLPLPAQEIKANPLQTIKLGWWGGLGVLIAGLGLIGYQRYSQSGEAVAKSETKNTHSRLSKKIQEFSISDTNQSEDIEHLLSDFLTKRYSNKRNPITHPDHLTQVDKEEAKEWQSLWLELRQLRYQPAALSEQLIGDWKIRCIRMLGGKV